MPFQGRVATRQVAYISLVTSIFYAIWFILTVINFYGAGLELESFLPIDLEPKIFGFIGTFGLGEEAYSWFIFIYATVTSCDVVLRLWTDKLILKATKRATDPKKALKLIFKWRIVFIIKAILFLIWPLGIFNNLDRITSPESLVPILVVTGMVYIVNKHVDELEGDTTPTYLSKEMMSPLINIKI